MNRASEQSVPRVFQSLLVAYVLLTGELVRAAQAVLFDLQGGGEGEFTVAVLLAITVDLVRTAPIFVYSRHPMGVLHPLILTTVLWPLLVAMPGKIQEFGGYTGLLLGEPLSAPFFAGLGWMPPPLTWQAVAWGNLAELVGLLSIFLGYSLVGSAAPSESSPRRKTLLTFDSRRLRTLLIALIVVSITVLLVLISVRGGLASHLGDMARGRFRSMAGLGPLVSAVDLGVVALIVWVAVSPRDARLPMFWALLIAVSAAQFISNGARSSTFAVFMSVGIAWALRTRRIPWRLAAIMAPLLFLSFGALNIIRTAGWTGETATQAIQGAGADDVLNRVQEEIEIRRSLESTVPIIWQGHELMGGPMWGSTYNAAIFAFIPRWLWEEKPRGPGSLYAQNFLGEVREGSAVPVNPTTEEFWNFGFPGIILLSAFYGALIRKAYEFYTRRQDNPFIVALFVLFATTFHLSTDDLVLFQQQAFLLMLVFGLALVFARNKTSSTTVDLRSLGYASGMAPPRRVH